MPYRFLSMKKINSKKEYLAEFKDKDDKALKAEALKQALDIRKLEVELYWKRTTYFWTINAAIFAGYFTIKYSNQNIDFYVAPLVSCIGLIISFGWYIANRGAKYWQENWELHVDLLEDEVMGPLYKTTPSTKRFAAFHPICAFPFSVSKVNQILSLFMTVIWAGIAALNIPWVRVTFLKWEYSHWLLILLTIATLVSLFFFGRTNRMKNIKVEMFTREYEKIIK